MPASIFEYVPQMLSAEEAGRRLRAALLSWGLVTTTALLLILVILLAPWARAHGHTLLSQIIYAGFSAACHQQAARSYSFEGFPLAVCARCWGLYAGLLAGLLLYPLVLYSLGRSLTQTVTPPRAWLMASAVPTTIDFALGFFGLWENTHLSRFLTASLFGAVAAFYVVPGVVDFSWRTRHRFNQ